MVPADFVQDGRILKGLPGVLTLLEDAQYGDDEALRWLYTDDDMPARRYRRWSRTAAPRSSGGRRRWASSRCGTVLPGGAGGLPARHAAPGVWLGVRVYRRPRRLLLTLLPVVAVFSLWDLDAIAAGHWSFDPAQTSDWCCPAAAAGGAAVLRRGAGLRGARLRGRPPGDGLAGGGRLTTPRWLSSASPARAARPVRAGHPAGEAALVLGGVRDHGGLPATIQRLAHRPPHREVRTGGDPRPRARLCAGGGPALRLLAGPVDAQLVGVVGRPRCPSSPDQGGDRHSQTAGERHADAPVEHLVVGALDFVEDAAVELEAVRMQSRLVGSSISIPGSASAYTSRARATSNAAACGPPGGRPQARSARVTPNRSRSSWGQVDAAAAEVLGYVADEVRELEGVAEVRAWPRRGVERPEDRHHRRPITAAEPCVYLEVVVGGVLVTACPSPSLARNAANFAAGCPRCARSGSRRR